MKKMGVIFVSLLAIFISVAVCFAELPKQVFEGQVEERAFDLINKAKQRMNAVNDYTCTFYKQEFVDGKMLPQEVIQMKFKKPHLVYMKWIGEVSKGREVIYRKGWNDNKMKSHDGTWLLKRFTVNLEPTEKTAMKGNRQPITNAGIVHIINGIEKDMKYLRDNKIAAKAVDEEIRTVDGVELHCLSAEMPKDKYPNLYAYKVTICGDEKTFLPQRVRIYDWADGQVRLVADYGFANIRLNVGLTDRDFDHTNPEYDYH